MNIKTTYKNGYRIRIINGKAYPSVTSILQLLPKDERLTNWKIKQALEYVQKNGLTNDSVKKALVQHKAILKSTAIEGEKYHKMIQDYETKNEWVKHPVLNKWITTFKQPNRFQGKNAELIVYSDTFGTSGAIDLFGYMMESIPYIIDIKRAKAVYLSHKIQTTLYGEMLKEKYPELKNKLQLGVYAINSPKTFHFVTAEEQRVAIKIFKYLRLLFVVMYRSNLL